MYDIYGKHNTFAQEKIQKSLRLWNIYTDEEREEAWDRITDTVKKYSDERVEQWNKEIDGLLTFVSGQRQ